MYGFSNYVGSKSGYVGVIANNAHKVSAVVSEVKSVHLESSKPLDLRNEHQPTESMEIPALRAGGQRTWERSEHQPTESREILSSLPGRGTVIE